MSVRWLYHVVRICSRYGLNEHYFHRFLKIYEIFSNQLRNTFSFILVLAQIKWTDDQKWLSWIIDFLYSPHSLNLITHTELTKTRTNLGSCQTTVKRHLSESTPWPVLYICLQTIVSEIIQTIESEIRAPELPLLHILDHPVTLSSRTVTTAEKWLMDSAERQPNARRWAGSSLPGAWLSLSKTVLPFVPQWHQWAIEMQSTWGG